LLLIRSKLLPWIQIKDADLAYEFSNGATREKRSRFLIGYFSSAFSDFRFDYQNPHNAFSRYPRTSSLYAPSQQAPSSSMTRFHLCYLTASMWYLRPGTYGVSVLQTSSCSAREQRSPCDKRSAGKLDPSRPAQLLRSRFPKPQIVGSKYPYAPGCRGSIERWPKE
jgi:hypothetical protein